MKFEYNHVGTFWVIAHTHTLMYTASIHAWIILDVFSSSKLLFTSLQCTFGHNWVTFEYDGKTIFELHHMYTYYLEEYFEVLLNMA